jgi:hypothetical protein
VSPRNYADFEPAASSSKSISRKGSGLTHLSLTVRKLTVRRLAVCFCFTMLATLGAGKNPFDERPLPPWHPIGPKTFALEETFADGPLHFNAMKIDISAPEVTLEAEPGTGELFHGEKLPAVAKRVAVPGQKQVIGGVNADFWRSNVRMYATVGFFVADGMIQSFPDPHRSVFVMTRDEKVSITPLTLTIDVEGTGPTFAVGAINEPEHDKAAILITPDYGAKFPAFNGQIVLLKLASPEFLPNQPVTASVLSTSETQTMTAPPSGHLLLLLPAKLDISQRSFKPGTSLTLNAVCKEVPGVITDSVGGAPRIVEKGKQSVQWSEEKVGKSFSTDRHPRTAVGIGKDGKTVYLVTVDGRQPKVSIGADLFTLGDYMVRLGCWDAMNLDGGGSTTMLVHGDVVNRPSDRTGPRSVSNALLVVSKPSSGRLAQFGFEPFANPLVVPSSAKVSLKLRPLDESFFPVSSPLPGDLTTENTGVVVSSTVKDSNLLLQVSPQAGSGTVSVRGGSASGTVNINSVNLTRLSVEPKCLVLDNGESVDLALTGIHDKEPIPISDDMATIVPQNSLVTMEDGKAKAAVNGAGPGVLAIELGGQKLQIPYFVATSSQQPIANFDAPQAYEGLFGQNYETSATRATAETSLKKTGAALRVDYAMNGKGRSLIRVPVNAPVPAEAVKLGVWIYGDGKEQWVRATVTDAQGTSYTADFTEGGKGVYWKNEWKLADCWVNELIPESSSHKGQPVLPLKVDNIYIAQDQEVMKGSGSLLLDELMAISPPR